MREKVKTFIESENLFEQNECVIVGVSGGPDSIALLDVLQSFKCEYNLRIVAVHIHHGIRGIYADRDAEFVKKQCEQMAIPLEIFYRNIPEEAQKMGISLEEAGRIARYACFEAVMKKWNGHKIAVAHHLNDQAETVLMRLIRGSGLDGLTAMLPKRNTLVRPLLKISRNEIERYCEDRNLDTIHDETNDESIFQRNKVRLELIPWLEENMNPQLVKVLGETAELLESDRAFLEIQMRDVFDRQVRQIGNENYQIACVVFNEMHKALQRRLIRYLIEIVGTLKEVSAVQIEEVILLIKRGVHGKEKNVGGVQFRISYESVMVYKVKEEPRRHVLEVQVVNRDAYDASLLEAHQVAIDAACIVGSIRLRYRQSGDVFQPIGMNHHKKIKKFFIDLKIPEKERDWIPIIEDEQEVIWVCPYRLAEPYRITAKTAKIAILSVHEVV